MRLTGFNVVGFTKVTPKEGFGVENSNQKIPMAIQVTTEKTGIFRLETTFSGLGDRGTVNRVL